MGYGKGNLHFICIYCMFIAFFEKKLKILKNIFACFESSSLFLDVNCPILELVLESNVSWNIEIDDAY